MKCHFKAVHSEKKFKCSFEGCDRSFSQNGILNAHYKTHADTKEFSCVICNQQFKSKSYLKKHQESHSGNRPHICHVCGNKYLQASHLKDHLSCHTQERRFACEYCKKTFRHKKQFTEHKNMHEGNRTYKCLECSYTTPFKTNLVVHRKRHVPSLFGGTKQDVDSVIIHTCQTCNLIYYTADDLNKHCETAHAGNKYHLCRLCEKLFLNKSSLIVHIQTYHDNEQYLKEAEFQQTLFSICSTCYVLFPSDELKDHLDICQEVIGQAEIKEADLQVPGQDKLEGCDTVQFVIEQEGIDCEGESPVLILVNIPHMEDTEMISTAELEVPAVSMMEVQEVPAVSMISTTEMEVPAVPAVSIGTLDKPEDIHGVDMEEGQGMDPVTMGTISHDLCPSPDGRGHSLDSRGHSLCPGDDSTHPLDLSMREDTNSSSLSGRFLEFATNSLGLDRSENGGRRRSVFLAQEPDYEHQGDMTVVDPAEVTGGD